MADDDIDDFSDPVDILSKLPKDFYEKCEAKKWQERKEAMEELEKLTSNPKLEAGDYGDLVRMLKRIIGKDTNVVVVGIAGKCMAGLANGLKKKFSPYAASAIETILEKFKEKKANVVTAMREAIDACLMATTLEHIQEDVVASLQSKNPAVKTETAAFLARAFARASSKTMLDKKVMKPYHTALLVNLNESDPVVRDSAGEALGVALKATGEKVMMPLFNDLDAMKLQKVKDFAEKAVLIQPKPTAASNRARAAADSGSVEEIVAPQDAAEIDPYEFLDPVEILSKLPKDFYEKCEAKKWQERKEAMEELEKLTSNPKLEAGDYGDLVRILKRIIGKDTNVVVVGIAGKCMAGLANGLKKKFSPYSVSVIGTILEKFKEKKANVVTAMREAIDACFVATTLEHVQEDVIASLQSKNPAVKAETSSFLARAFAKVPNKTMLDKKIMKPYHTALLVNINESDPAVRDAAAEALGVALKAAGEKVMMPLLQDLDAMKLQKVKDFAKTAVVAAPKPAPAPVKPPPKQAPAKAEATKSSSAVNVTSNKKAPSPKKPITLARKPVAKPELPQSLSLEELNEPKSPPNVANAGDDGRRIDISSQLTSQLIESLADKNWKTRDEALDKISVIISNAKNIQPNLGDLPTALSERLQDSNRNISANAFLVCQNLATVLGPHCKQHLPTLLPNILAGLSDSKPTIRNTVIACVNAWAENAGIKEVFQREVIADALKAGNPYLRQEVFQWLTVRLPPLKAVNKDDLTACLPYVYACIEDRNPDVRKRAQEVILPFMIHIGYDGMTRATNRLKPSSKTAIQSLLDKARPNLPAKPSATAVNAKAAGATKTGSVLKQQGSKSSNETHFSNSSLNRTFDNSTKADDRSRTLDKGKAGMSRIGQGQPPKADSPPDYDYSPPPQNGASPPGESSPPMVNANNMRRESYPNLNSNMISANHSMPSAIGMGNHIVETNRYTLPQQYQINYEMIDNMFGPQDLMPMPPLQLYDTNTEHLGNEVPMKLPARRVVTLPQLSTLSASNAPVLAPRAAQAIDLAVSQVGNPDLRLSMEAIVQLETLISDPEVSNVMGERVDHLLSIVTMQLRKLQPMLSSSSPDKLLEMNKLYRCIVHLLQALYKQGHSPLAKNGTKNTVRELIYHLLTLIIDTNVVVLQDATFICKTVNVLVVRIIEHSDPNAVICGLIRLLNDTLQMASNPRLLELVMKCQWKLLKQFSDWGADHNYTFDVDSIIREFHAFIKNNPFVGPNSRDLTPIKTMKTILHALVMHVGGEQVLKALYKMPDLKGSETEVYISKLIARECSKKRVETTNTLDRNSNTHV